MAQRKGDEGDRMNVRPGCAEEAANLIGKAFVWGATEEGHDYWMEITNRLYAIATDHKGD